MSGASVNIVIVGGGISGLSCAYYLNKMFAEKERPVHIKIIEKNGQLGGKIQTMRREGFVIEKGPDSFLARKLPIIHLSRELGLEDQLVATSPQAKQTYIVYKGKLHPMPPGLILGIPTQVTPFMKTGLISPAGKARAALDLVLPRRSEEGDESLGNFLRRRLGREVLERIAEPLLSGIYAGDTSSLSLLATFPQFHAVEKKYRSLILGMLAGKKHAPDSQGLPPIARSSMFLTYRNGLSTLVERLEDELREDVQWLLNQGVSEISRTEDAYNVRLDDGETLIADAVVLAVPAYDAVKLLGDQQAELKPLNSIRYTSVANVVMAFNRNDLSNVDMSGSGFVVPKREGKHITACTWTSSKWPHSTPEGKALVRCYVGRAGDDRHIGLSDEQIQQLAAADLQSLMGLRAKPLFTSVTHWHDSMPQYPVGHLENIRNVRSQLSAAMPGVLLTGSAYHGVGIPDCIKQGKDAAEQAIAYISGKAESGAIQVKSGV